MKNISEILSCIKQYIYTFLFYFLRLFYSDCSHSLCHPSFGLSKDYSPSGKELNTSSQEDAYFLGRCTLAYNFYFISCHPFLRLSNSSLTLR